MTLAEWVRVRRLQRGWTQTELGRRVGAESATVSRWERGVFQPDLPTFRRLCVEFGCSADELLGLPEGAATEPPAELDDDDEEPREGAA